MKWETWTTLGDLERTKVFKELSAGNVDELLRIAKEACEAFLIEFAGILHFTYVGVGFEQDGRIPAIACVTDGIGHEALHLVPRMYYGFRVQHEDVGEKHQDYLREWSEYLRATLGWDDSKVNAWAERWEPYLRGEKVPFYHRPAVHYVALEIARSMRPDLKGDRRAVSLAKMVERFLVAKRMRRDWLTDLDGLRAELASVGNGLD